MFSFPSFLLASSFSVCIWVHIHFTPRYLPSQTWRPDLFLLCVPPVSPSLLKCIYCLSLPPALCCVVHACSPKFLYLHVCELPGFHLVLWITFVFWAQIIIKGLLHVLLLHLCSQPACHSEREREKTLFIYLSQCIIFKRFFFHQEAKSVKYPQANKTKEGKWTFFIVYFISYTWFTQLWVAPFLVQHQNWTFCVQHTIKKLTRSTIRDFWRGYDVFCQMGGL